MKDFAMTTALLVVVFGLFLAVPVFGAVVGAGIAVYFLYHAIKQDNTRGDS